MRLHATRRLTQPTHVKHQLSKAKPMLDTLRHAEFVVIPLLTDATLSSRFGRLSTLCEWVAGPYVDAQEIHEVVEQVQAYGRHIRECLTAHLDDKILPPEPDNAPTRLGPVRADSG